MARVRVSTTVDQGLIEQARALDAGKNDATLLDDALHALLERHRRARVDKEYEAYDRIPLDTADDWGDLASWREAAARS